MSGQGINTVCWRIGEAVLQGVLLEVTSFPKPGLVTPLSRGAHNDMNLQTFMLSSAAIAPCFTLCAAQGFKHQGELTDLLSNIRLIGIDYEKRLLECTDGVNTQRGILFSGSVLAAAAGYISAHDHSFDYANVSHTVSQMCRGLCQRDFSCIKTAQDAASKTSHTAGEQLYLRYGTTGIRGEAEAGFPTVLAHGLPALSRGLAAGFGMRYALVYCLLVIMSQCDDTTILWRGGKEALNQLKQRAAAIVTEDAHVLHESDEKTLQLESLNQFCMENRLSPGGSADLLAITVAMYLLKNEGILNEII